MTLPDTTFVALSDAMLNLIADSVESLDAEGELEVERLDGMVMIELPSGRQFVVHRHAPSQQIWLSSPLSGGLHFSYDDNAKAWALNDGRRLDTLLKAEIDTLLDEE